MHSFNKNCKELSALRKIDFVKCAPNTPSDVIAIVQLCECLQNLFFKLFVACIAQNWKVGSAIQYLHSLLEDNRYCPATSLLCWPLISSHHSENESIFLLCIWRAFHHTTMKWKVVSINRPPLLSNTRVEKVVWVMEKTEIIAIVWCTSHYCCVPLLSAPLQILFWSIEIKLII